MRERAAFLPAPDGTLFGILSETEPAAEPGLAAVVMPEGVSGGLIAQNAVMVRLARAIALAGVTSFRFDFPGIGESTGDPPYFKRSVPRLDDLDVALQWLGGEGYRRFVLVGSCLGAQEALLAASARPAVCGLALLSTPFSLEWHRPQLVSETMLGAALELADRGIPTLICVGRDDDAYDEFEAAWRLGLDAVTGVDGVHIVVFDGSIHSFGEVDLQPKLIGVVADWVRALTSGCADGRVAQPAGPGSQAS